MENSISFADAAQDWQLGFQDPATPMMEGIIFFHNYLFFYLVFIVVFVSWLLFRCLTLYSEEVHPNPDIFTHSTSLEIIWTIVPALILLLISIPSFALLYSMDEVIEPQLTIKVVGHQWYWSYQYGYSKFIVDGEEQWSNYKYDSYMCQEAYNHEGEASEYTGDKWIFRLLDVSDRLMIPRMTHTRLLVSATDVLHSFAVPSLGVKVDACPGRLNQVFLYIKRDGVFYGQCSEICGVNHGFMPICVQSTNPEKWEAQIQFMRHEDGLVNEWRSKKWAYYHRSAYGGKNKIPFEYVD
jgi:cytochrome c oxidase subunit 2